MDCTQSQRREAGEGFKVCKGCDDELERYLFPPSERSPDGRHHLCFACRAEFNILNHPTGCASHVSGMFPDRFCIQEEGRALCPGSSDLFLHPRLLTDDTW